jgi:hypothetical protein
MPQPTIGELILTHVLSISRLLQAPHLFSDLEPPHVQAVRDLLVLFTIGLPQLARTWPDMYRLFYCGTNAIHPTAPPRVIPPLPTISDPIPSPRVIHASKLVTPSRLPSTPRRSLRFIEAAQQSANTSLNVDSGQLPEYHQLLRCSEDSLWEAYACDEFARLAQSLPSASIPQRRYQYPPFHPHHRPF